MKKRIFCLAAALVLLCSCAAEKTDCSSPESKTDPSGQAAPDGLHILSAQSAAGYYLLEKQRKRPDALLHRLRTGERSPAVHLGVLCARQRELYRLDPRERGGRFAGRGR